MKTEKTETIKVEVSTRAYEMNYGKLPKGRGGWGFCPSDKWDGQDYLDHVFFAPSGTYREAKAAAVAHFKTLGIPEIVVCT